MPWSLTPSSAATGQFSVLLETVLFLSPPGVCNQGWIHSRNGLIILGFVSSVLPIIVPFIYAVVWGVGHACCKTSEEMFLYAVA